jgi:hypothetical protein
MWAAGVAGGAYLAAFKCGGEPVALYVAAHAWAVWLVGPYFAALTGEGGAARRFRVHAGRGGHGVLWCAHDVFAAGAEETSGLPSKPRPPARPARPTPSVSRGRPRLPPF